MEGKKHVENPFEEASDKKGSSSAQRWQDNITVVKLRLLSSEVAAPAHSGRSYVLAITEFFHANFRSSVVFACMESIPFRCPSQQDYGAQSSGNKYEKTENFVFPWYISVYL